MARSHSPFARLRYDIFGVAMKVQDALGTAHEEKVYHRALQAALQQAGFQVRFTPRYLLRDVTGRVIATYYPDLEVTRDGITVLVELKADPQGLQPSHRRQARAYLSVARRARAVLLINFAQRPLEREVVFRKDV